MDLFAKGLDKRAKRALIRQLEYQEDKAAGIKGHEQELIASMMLRSQEVRKKLEDVVGVPGAARVLEVGCGAHGLIFYFGAGEALGVDPLADHYSRLFPAWQGRAKIIAAAGEELPFEDSSFDIVLCDNVVDHAKNPRRILEEIVRVLKPGAGLYFEVNVHHPFYHVAATIHAAWRALGIPFEITPFADHTVHLTPRAAKSLFRGLPLKIEWEQNDIERARARPSRNEPRHIGDHLKRLFFKNAKYEVIARREATS